MTQQNRVDPWGALVATPERGQLMGNRGILHDERGQIVRQWATNTWVTCLLEFNGRSSPGVFRPGRYSKLFFLDEATAFAAGHRPCGECQHQRYVSFKKAWCEANGAPSNIRATDMDRRLHADRVTRGRRKVTYQAHVWELPYGTFVEDGQGGAAMVGEGKALLPWTFSSYLEAVHVPPGQVLNVLTPASVVRAFLAGFRPLTHHSAGPR